MFKSFLWPSQSPRLLWRGGCFYCVQGDLLWRATNPPALVLQLPGLFGAAKGSFDTFHCSLIDQGRPEQDWFSFCLASCSLPSPFFLQSRLTDLCETEVSHNNNPHRTITLGREMWWKREWGFNSHCFNRLTDAGNGSWPTSPGDLLADSVPGEGPGVPGSLLTSFFSSPKCFLCFRKWQHSLWSSRKVVPTPMRWVSLPPTLKAEFCSDYCLIS